MIYSIQDKGFDFPRLDLMIDDIIDARPESVAEDDVLDFCQTNCSMSSWWPKPETMFIGENHNIAIPDISKWIDASLVLSPKAYRFLGEVLSSWGELLPVVVKGEIFYIFNCHTFVQVDESQSEKEYFDGEEVGIKRLVFSQADARDKLLFKTSYDSCIEIYCGDLFKSLVEDFDLTGVSFEVV